MKERYISERRILSCKNFVLDELYSIMFEHSLILDCRIRQYDTRDQKNLSPQIYSIKKRFLLFLLECVLLFQVQISIAQMLDLIDYQARYA